MKFGDANLQVNEKSSFTDPPSCILPLFSKNTPRLLLPKNLWKCVSTISFRKYKRVTCSTAIPPSQLSPCRRSDWTFSWVQFLSNKLKLIRFLRCKITRTSIFLLILCFDMYFFHKNLIVLHHGDNNFLFCFDICIKFTLSAIISTMEKWQHLSWCVPIYDKKMLERKKTFHHSKIKSF